MLPTIGAAGASVIDLAGAGQGRLTLGAIAGFANLSASTPYLLKISAPNRVPTIYDLTVRLDETGALQTVDLATRSNAVRRDVILGGNGNDVLSGGAGEEWIFGGAGNDVLTGGLDRQAEDLLFGQDGDDRFQIIPDRLPTLPGSTQTLIPTLSDRLDGGLGDDQVWFLGGDLDQFSRPVPDWSKVTVDFFPAKFITRSEVSPVPV